MPGFWTDATTWWRASKNTSVCLFGCAIGDLGLIWFLQDKQHGMPIWMVMALAMISGIFTSMLLETILLRIKEQFTWRQAVHVAASMSLMSMLAMELVMNLTDIFITGGARITWFALPFVLLAGFLTPLPYNYWKLKKLGRACH